MRTCDGNNKKNKTTTTGLITEVSFPRYRRGRGIQQSVTLGDSALTVQHITLLYTSFDWKDAPWGAESSQRWSHRNVHQSRVAQKHKFNDFCGNIFLTKSFENNKKKRLCILRWWGTWRKKRQRSCGGKRSLMYDEYNLCEMAHRNQLLFLQQQFA